ncbi:MAG: sterol desaturase family protein [Desulfobulbaceae bacterium]|nr:sterol desaturase family protein [Desulfobulbaceae bacterium]
MLLIDNEVFLRLGFFMGIFLCMAIWEKLAPRRALTHNRLTRWTNNLGLTVFNAFLVSLVFPAAAVGTALYAESRGWGLLQMTALPAWAEGLAAIVILDLAIYSQHVLFHRVSLFWRLHRMHHTDLDIDVTTGARFHPVEILLSMGIKMGVVLALGAPAWSVIVFEILLNGTSMFNHSDIFMPARADGILRLLVVTPDMHRIHHSVIIRETNSNYGFNFPWWDRLFNTYRAQPAAGHIGMTLGLANYRDPKWLTFQWMLMVPFMRSPR